MPGQPRVMLSVLSQAFILVQPKAGVVSRVASPQKALCAAGITRPDKGKLQAYWMAVAREALTGSRSGAPPVVRDGDKSYQYGLTATGDTLTVSAHLYWCRLSLRFESRGRQLSDK